LAVFKIQPDTSPLVKIETNMTSPFPGMDPFLEGNLWPDLSMSIALGIEEILLPLITQKYSASGQVLGMPKT
jgi:hypothetical protein